MRYIRILAVVLTVLMIGAVAADPVAARPNHFAKSSVHQHQVVSQWNVNHQSHNYGGVQVSVQSNSNSQTAVSHSGNYNHQSSGDDGGSGGPGNPGN